MIINQALSREIYGRKPWMVDQAMFSSLFNMLMDLRNGVQYVPDGEKANRIYLYNLKTGTRVVQTNGKATSSSNEQLIAVTMIDGVITKAGGMSSDGMQQISAQLMAYDADPEVIGHLVLVDSGGGSETGMNIMSFALQSAVKPKVGLIKRDGIAASAAYGIICECDWVMAENNEAEAGSIGTMLSFEAKPNRAVGADGWKQVTIYASASTKKNLWFEEALNNDNYDLAISEVLDPANERFTGKVKTRRPNVKPDQLDGSVYQAKDVVGTLIDEIGSEQAAMAKIVELHNARKGKSNSKKSNNQSTMTKAELLAQEPALYAEVFGAGKDAGVSAERDRAGSWMAHLETDPEAVKKGIEGGEAISATARETFLVKASAKATLGNIKKDGAADIKTEEAKNDAPKTEMESFFSDVKQGIKILKN